MVYMTVSSLAFELFALDEVTAIVHQLINS